MMVCGQICKLNPRSQHLKTDFIDMMEAYFDQDFDAKLVDIHPELHYQVGKKRLISKPEMANSVHPTGRSYS